MISGIGKIRREAPQGVGLDYMGSWLVLVHPGEPVGRVDPGEAELHPPYGSTGGLGSGHAVGMPYYRRKRIAGGTYFFTVNLRDRRSRSGLLEYAQQMAAHESAPTTKLYDRRHDQVTRDQVERIAL
jgi:hypothetical protein